MTGVVSFPILQLPQRALNTSLQFLSPRNIIIFSLISKSAKQAAVAVNLQDVDVTIIFCETISIEIVGNLWEDAKLEWDSTQFGLRKLIDHSLSVFHMDHLDYLDIHNAEHDWEHIYNALDGHDVFTISTHVYSDDIHLQRIINKCSPRMFYLRDTFRGDAPDLWLHRNVCVHRDLLMIDPRCSLSTVLSVNCKAVWFNEHNSATDINLFMRHWVHGSHGTLKNASFRTNDRDSYEQYFSKIFKSMHYKPTPIEDVLNPPNGWILAGGMDIYNCYGTRASVMIEDMRVIMFVWI